jgi:hypothetical protein
MAGCGRGPLNLIWRRPVRVRVHRAIGDRKGYELAGTLQRADGRSLARYAPIRMEVQLGPASGTVETDKDGRWSVLLSAADFQRRELPDGELDLVFRLAPREGARCGLTFGADGEQRDVVCVGGAGARWAVVVIVRAIPLLNGQGGWVTERGAPAGVVGTPQHVGAILRFLQREATGPPPAVYYVVTRPGVCTRQIRSFLDAHRLPMGGMMSRPVGVRPVPVAGGVDPFLVESLRALNARIGGVQWAVMGRLGTGDGPSLFAAKGHLQARLAGGFLWADAGQPWPAKLKEMLVLTPIHRVERPVQMARVLQAAGWLPPQATRRAAAWRIAP